jgi:tetratricopeptide (TPR) repeat protein
MPDLASQLINLHRERPSGSGAPTAIFGTASTLSQSIQAQETYRLGIWPCRSESHPEFAMGLMTIINYMLDGLRDVRAYPLFIQSADDDRIQDSQFDVEDWQPDNLNENVALWGTLSQSGTTWTLSLGIENDVIERDDEIKLTYTADSAAALVSQLPTIAEDIADELGELDITVNAYEPFEAYDDRVIGLMRDLFAWQSMLLRALAGANLSDNDIQTALRNLLERAKPLPDDFGGWVTGVATAHALLPGYSAVNTIVVDMTGDVIDSFAVAYPAIYISNGLFRLGHTERGIQIMEAEVSQRPQTVLSWLTLADLYRRGGRMMELIDTFQRAIEVEAVSATLYRNYAAVLELIDDDQMVEEVILVDPEAYYDQIITWEAITAYAEARKRNPESLSLLQRETLLLMDVAIQAEDRLLNTLRDLLKRDETGEFVRTVAENVIVIDDVDLVLDVFEEVAESQPDRVDLKVNLAVAYLAADEYDLAAEELHDAKALTEDDGILSDIARLLLNANDPEFEARFGEIEAQVDGGSISGSDIDFLETTVEQAPSMTEAFELLGKAYMARREYAEALEALLDGHKHHPKSVPIMLLISNVLWASGEQTTAFDYLNKALKVNPNFVPLLATTGLYLFESGQEQDARAYLARAEAISPRDRTLAAVRRHIADTMSRRD